MDNIISNRDDIPKYMTLSKTILCKKDTSKGNANDNYKPISSLPAVDNYRSVLSLPFMWKLMTGTVVESIYNFLDVNDKLPVEQKGCKKEIRGTKDQLLIDKAVTV